jgi:hypothetical protein
MSTHLTNRPFPEDAGDRHVLYADDGQVIATWYEPHPDVLERMKRRTRRAPSGFEAFRFPAMLMVLSFLTGLLF